jgi:large subunit ribosomal protein L22
MNKEITAKLRFLRMSPKRTRLVADLMRGHKVTKSIAMLSVLNKRPAKPLLKLLLSAVANAQHNFSLPVDTLRISKITVDQGPVLKRWMPKAHGRATPVREPTAHIKLVLISEEKLEKKKKDSKSINK